MTTAEVIEGFRSGLVTSDAFVWKDGMGDWVPIMDCVELAPLLSGPTDQPAPVAGQTPFAPAVSTAPKLSGVPSLAGSSGASGGAAARTVSAKAQVGADLFGNLEAAGSEDVDVSVGQRGAPPILPGATAYDDKPTGQRNENSVLFSLDAMKAGFVGGSSASPDKTSKPAAPKPGAPRPSQASNPDDPFGMSGAALAGPGGNPIFSLNANQALLTAPAPPEPKPVPVQVFAPPGSIPPGGMDEKTKKLVMFGGLGAGAIIVLLLGMLIFGGDSKTADADSAAGTPSALADAKRDDKDDKDDKKAPPAEEKKPEPEAAKPAESEEKKPEEPAKTEPAKAEGPKSSGHSAAAAPKKEEPAPAGPSTAPPFSKASAISALGAASSSAAGCKKSGGPTGVGKVQVTFAPSGRVTSATVMGPPFAGTAVGGCVAGKFRGAKVPAFSGNAVTVSKSFAIN